MSDCDCSKLFCNLLSKVYLTINISSLILLYFLQKNKFYEDECFLQKIYYSELDPITEIYKTNYKTENSIQLGYLDEFSGKYTKIYPQEIYKWNNQYINIKRNKVYSPNQYNDYDYLIQYEEKILVDIKVSYKYKIDYSYKRNSNICFSWSCLSKNGYCEIPILTYRKYLKDNINNFISYNSIQITSKNTPEIFDEGEIYLFLIYRYSNFTKEEGQMELVDIYKIIMKSIIIINPVLRLLKIFLISYIKASKNCFNSINVLSLIIHTINIALFLVITIYYRKLPDEDESLDAIHVSLVVLEFICFFLGITMHYDFLLDEPNCHCFCDCINEDSEKKKIEKVIPKMFKDLNIKNEENEQYKLEIDKNKKTLENVLFEIKQLNAEKEENNYKLYLNRKHKSEYNIYKNLKTELIKKENILQKRAQELEKLKEIYDKNKSINRFPYNDINKLNLNCIYFDRDINAADYLSSGYEFFKFLKNRVDGIFFGIKEKGDLRFIEVQLPKNIKFILIIHGNDDDFPFLQTYHTYFSHIIIFNNDKDDIVNLKKFKNIYAIESDYKNIYLRLKEINIEFNEKNIKKYKPRNLYLLDDYIGDNNIRKCQLEILKNTFLDRDLNNINNISTQGLTKNEVDNFIKFINNDLKEIKDIDGDEKIDIEDISDDEEEEEKNHNINNNIIYRNNNNLNVIEIKDNDDIDNQSRNKMNNFRIQLREEMINSEEFSLKNSLRNKINSKKKFNFNIEINNRYSLRLNEPEIQNITIKSRKLGKIEKTPKKLINEFLSKEFNFKTPESLINLYSRQKEKFDFYINRWLFSFNYNIYKEIAPIVGKMMNILYKIILERKNPILGEKKLYRGFCIKKADIFLYKACEGDVFFYPSFTSTSQSKKIVEDIFIKDDPSFNYKDLSQMCNCLITIDYNLENDDVQQAADIQDFSKFIEEERLFPPFSFFRIKKVEYNIPDSLNKGKEKIYDGTKSNPFEIKLEIIKRNFYLDSTIIKHFKVRYVRDSNKWKLC